MTRGKVSEADLHAFIFELFQACGADKAQSDSAARNMVWSELVGRQNFGVKRIEIHLKRLECGVLNRNCTPKFNQTAPGTCSLDADNGFGFYAGEIAMTRAIELAKINGIGMVGVKNSNFFGTGAFFVNQAAESGMISLAMSNSYPKVAATGGLSAVLGTNPFAFGAPRKSGTHLLVDFATSSLAGSTVREHIAKGEQLPEGLAIQPDGQPLTDPNMVDQGALLPFGGAKGYGISLAVEILSGVLTGSGFSHSVKSTYADFKEQSDSGHCMIAIDIEKYIPLHDFYDRFDMLVDLLKASNEADEVLLPGEIRWHNFQTNREQGIDIPCNMKAALCKIASRYGVVPPWSGTV